VGKTSLLITRTTKVFPEDVPKLLEFAKTTLRHVSLRLIIVQKLTPRRSAGREYTLQLWDTTWEQGYTRLCSLWYPHTDVFLFCFSIDSWDSLDRVWERWYPEILHMCPDVPSVLVGLKTDLRDDSDMVRELESRKLGPVKFDDAAKLARDLRCAYVECSAREGQGVDKVFEEVSSETIHWVARTVL
jgi:small GTP-binding protein